MASPLNFLDQALDVAGSYTKTDQMDISGEPLSIGQKTGLDGYANISTNGLITGLIGFTQNSVNKYLTLSGSSFGINNGTFKIISVINGSSVVIDNVSTIADNSIPYYETEPYSLEDDLNYERSDRSLIKGVPYYQPIPIYRRVTDTATDVSANLTNIAGKTTDAKAILVNRKFNNYSTLIGDGYIVLNDTGNLKHADAIDRTGVPINDGADIGNSAATYVEVLDGYGEPLYVLDGYYQGYRIIGRTYAGSSVSPNSVQVEFRAVAIGGAIEDSVPYVWESGQTNIIDLYYAYRQSLATIDEEALRVTLVNGLNTGFSENQHENLDTLVHDLAENGYGQIIYTNRRITAYIYWTTPAMVTKIREYLVEYSGRNISKITTIQYNSLGNEVSRLVEDVGYTDRYITSITAVKTMS